MRAQYLAAGRTTGRPASRLRDGVLLLQWNDMQKLLRLCGVSQPAPWRGRASRAPRCWRPSATRRSPVRTAWPTTSARRARGASPGAAGRHQLEGPRAGGRRGPRGRPPVAVPVDLQLGQLPRQRPDAGELPGRRLRAEGEPNDPTRRAGVLAGRVPGLAEIHGDHHAGRRAPGGEPGAGCEPAGALPAPHDHYVQHNCSITVSFDEAEIPAMVDWFMEHWGRVRRGELPEAQQPAGDRGGAGLQVPPAGVVSRERYEAYIARLSPIDIEADKSAELLEVEDCSTGACPIRR